MRNLFLFETIKISHLVLISLTLCFQSPQTSISIPIHDQDSFSFKALIHWFHDFRNEEKTSPAELNGTHESFPTSRLRQAFPQFCAVSAKNLLMITFGSTLGFSTILIPELQKKDSEIPVTMEELTWISKHLICLPVPATRKHPLTVNTEDEELASVKGLAQITSEKSLKSGLKRSKVWVTV